MRARRPRRGQVNALTMAALVNIYETACFPRVGRGGVLEGAETALRRGLGRYRALLGDVGRRPAALGGRGRWSGDDVTRWDNGSGRLTVRRSKTDASPRTVYLTPGCHVASRCGPA